MKTSVVKKLVTVVVIFGSFFGMILATEAATEDNMTLQEMNLDMSDFPDNEELFAGYVETMLYEGLYEDVSTYAALGSSRLSQGAKQIYSTVRDQIKAVAAGELTSTEFEINQAFTLKASELGVNKITEDNYETAFNAMMQQIIQYVIMDSPYDLYWYNETSTLYWGYYVSVASDGSSLTIGKIALWIPVAIEYRADEADEYSISAVQVQKAKNAKNKAVSIVNANASRSPYEKLVAYKDAICELASYNYDVVNNGSSYASPWHVIWVFDEDVSTKVVCEGYAKAFQYLCDLSNLTCYTVSGAIAGGTGAGYHMWNIVTIDNENYLVDVTNCDSGTIGYPDKLFLAGTMGNVTDGYIFQLGYDVSYVYDEVQVPLLGADTLTLSSVNYNPKTAGKWVYSSNGWWYSYSDGGYPKNEWKQIDGIWYWFDASGYMKTGWQYIGGQWYYFNGSGAMVTGWQYIGGQWYCFNASGAMLTGWQYIGNKWYYMNSAGHMCTGWICIANKWYYMAPGSGEMQTGWLYLENNWYYLKTSGEMAVGQIMISGRVNRFSSSGVWLGY